MSTASAWRTVRACAPQPFSILPRAPDQWLDRHSHAVGRGLSRQYFKYKMLEFAFDPFDRISWWHVGGDGRRGMEEHSAWYRGQLGQEATRAEAAGVRARWWADDLLPYQL